MEQSNNQSQPTAPRTTGGGGRGRSSSSTGDGGYRSVARQAVQGETDVKLDAGPAVSFTVVGENVTFTQHFNF